MPARSVDFFVSYVSADRPWAEWIAWELEQAGYSTFMQAWDIQPGSNFVLSIHEAARAAQQTVVVLSPALLASPYATAEWAAMFRDDPAGTRRKLVPVRVRESEPSGLLGSLIYLDIVGLSEAAARATLLAGLTPGRAKPVTAPTFPSIGSAGKREGVRAPSAGTAIFNVPVSTRTFVGRSRHLEQLAEGLVGEDAAATAQVHVIQGVGGVGKTQLAARYARMHRDDYDAIWWLRAGHPSTLRTDFAAFSVALGLTDADADEEDSIASARGWLEQNTRWLMVFDDAPGPDAISGLLPESRGGHVLITSRARTDWLPVRARSLALNAWERAESREFLRARTGEHDSRVLDQVAETLADLPLALEQAAAYTNIRAITLTGYLERLGDRAAERIDAHSVPPYDHAIATVWRLAFEQIAQHQVASELLAVCAHLAPERIPRELLETAAQLNTAGVSERGVDGAIELLLAYALLTPDAEQTFSMHRVIGQLSRDTVDPAAQVPGAATAVRALALLWPQRPRGHEQRVAGERLLAHALTATECAQRANLVSEQTASLLVRVGEYQVARAQLTSARTLVARALAITEEVFGPDHPEVAVALGNLGVLQEQLGEFEAARATQLRALATFEDVYGPAHAEVAVALGNLGMLQKQLGEFAEALVSFQRAVAITEAVYGTEHPQVAVTLGNLGNVQRELGDLGAAHRSLERALATLEDIYGPEHPQVAITLGNLGNVQRDLGRFEDALASLQRALAITEAAYGAEHPQVAITLSNLGNVQRDLGRFEDALASDERALAINETVYGADRFEGGRVGRGER